MALYKSIDQGLAKANKRSLTLCFSPSCLRAILIAPERQVAPPAMLLLAACLLPFGSRILLQILQPMHNCCQGRCISAEAARSGEESLTKRSQHSALTSPKGHLMKAEPSTYQAYGQWTVFQHGRAWGSTAFIVYRQEACTRGKGGTSRATSAGFDALSSCLFACSLRFHGSHPFAQPIHPSSDSASRSPLSLSPRLS